MRACFQRVAAAALLGVALAGCPGPEGDNCVPVGALLPFTGDLSSSSANIERAMILATEEINAAGGVANRPLCLIARDTASDPERGLQVAKSLLDHHQVRALFGPQNDDLALRIIPELRRTSVLGISGGTTAPALRFAVDDDLWFRTSPSAITLGQTLARRMIDDGVQRMAVIFESSEFGVGWASVLQTNFTAMGGSCEGIFSFQPDQRSFSAELARAFAPGVDAVVLVANARTGATIVEEWAIRGRIGSWYFVPALADQVFVDNVPPGALDGMVGISPAVGEHTAHLQDHFAARFNGDTALLSAHFYYDAVLLWALAAEAARGDAEDVPATWKIRDALRRVSGAPGTATSCHDLEHAIDLARQGDDIDFEGASGGLEFDERGEILGARHRWWHIDDATLVYEELQ